MHIDANRGWEDNRPVLGAKKEIPTYMLWIDQTKKQPLLAALKERLGFTAPAQSVKEVEG